MADRSFKIVIRAGKGAGAPLQAVIGRLGALQRLYDASTSACLRPGAANVKIPGGARELLSLRLTNAEPTRSLAASVAEPAVPSDYEGNYADLPIQGNSTFRKAVFAAANRESAQIIHLFPQKADQLRVLKAVSDLAPDEHEDPVVIENFDESREPLVFRVERREWAQKSRPSLQPEVQTLKGMIKTGALGGSPQFKLFDGSRSIILKPASNGVRKLRDHFGQIAGVIGRAHFTSARVVREMTEITEIEPFQYRAQEFSYGERRFLLTRPLLYETEAGLDAKSFTLNNNELGTVGYGKSLAEAIDAAVLDFVALWDDIAQADEAEVHRR